VVENALALLLRGVGYDARILEVPSSGREEVLAGEVDLLLLSPGLSAEGREEGLALLRGGASERRIPVLRLSSALEEGRFSDEVAVLPWPSGFEEVARVIEGALTPAAAPAIPGSADAPH
jgi:hypothetical protein